MSIHRKYSLDELYKSTVLGVIILVLVIGCSSNISLIDSDSSAASAESAPAAANQVSIPASLTDEQAVLIDLYKRVNPSVVNIAAYGGQSGFPEPAGPGGRIPGGPGGPPGPSQGSGFVYDQAGYIVTNAHVVAGSNQIETTFADGTIAEAVIVGLDPDSDLAVLKVAQLPAGVKTLPLGNMNELAVGQTVVAIGNPFGLEGTLTRGIISALGRTIPALTPFSIPHAIQTDAAINPGNSGGPLLDLQGRVVGVTAQGVTSGDTPVNSGVSLAIPVDIVSRVVPALIENGQYDWAWLGIIAGDNVTPALVRAMNLPVQRGAYIIQIAPGGPADQAGLRGANNMVIDQGRPMEIGGDVITTIDGQPVRSSDDLLTYIALQTRPGQDVTLTVIRSGTTQEIPLRMGVRPAQQPPPAFGRP